MTDCDCKNVILVDNNYFLCKNCHKKWTETYEYRCPECKSLLRTFFLKCTCQQKCDCKNGFPCYKCNKCYDPEQYNLKNIVKHIIL